MENISEKLNMTGSNAERLVAITSAHELIPQLVYALSHAQRIFIRSSHALKPIPESFSEIKGLRIERLGPKPPSWIVKLCSEAEAYGVFLYYIRMLKRCSIIAILHNPMWHKHSVVGSFFCGPIKMMS